MAFTLCTYVVSPRWTHVARVDMCHPDAMCTGWKRSALCYENGELRYRAFSPHLLPITMVATVIFDTICIALDVYYILKGGETFQVTFKLHIILSSCRRREDGHF